MTDMAQRAAMRNLRKAPDAFRTISEVASDLDVPQHVLRFWESKFDQVKPLKRGGGRRYYRPEDVNLLRGIRHLLYSDGYTIKGVQKLLRGSGAKVVIESGRKLAKSGAAGARPLRQLDDRIVMSHLQKEKIGTVIDELSVLRDALRLRRR